MEFKAGDIVRFKRDATLDDMIRDYWAGSQVSTINALKKNEFDQFMLTETVGGFLADESDNIINTNLIELVQRGPFIYTKADIARMIGKDEDEFEISEDPFASFGSNIEISDDDLPF